MPAETQTRTPEVSTASTLADKFSAWSERIDRLNQETALSGAERELPEWWSKGAQTYDIKTALKSGDAAAEDIARYLELYAREAEARAKITGYEMPDPLSRTVDDLGAEVVGKGFAAERADGPLHRALLESLSQTIQDGHEVATPALQTLRQAYGLGRVTQVLGIRGGEYEEKLHGLLLNNRIIRWIRHNDQPHGKEDTWSDAQAASRVWMAEAIEAATDASHEEAMDYAFSASRRAEDGSVVDMLKKFDYFGADRIRRISQFAGIVGIDAYSVEQLERMDAFAADPKGFAEKLKNHDVSVMMVNRVGDHNGVMTRAASEFDDAGKDRMLFFEIASAADILKAMALLNKYGIKPSTLILSAHSSPGRFVVADERMRDLPRRDVLTIAGRKAVAMANIAPDLAPGAKEYSMHGMRGMARAVEDYMQPSRGIDDDAGSVGRKKIIFYACHSGAEAEQREINEDGEKIQIGTESVVSQLGKDLVASGVASNVDIYGAPAGTQMRRTASGIRYLGQPADVESDRPPLRAVRIRLDQGKLAKTEVDEITLREPSSGA